MFNLTSQREPSQVYSVLVLGIFQSGRRRKEVFSLSEEHGSFVHVQSFVFFLL